MRYLTIFLFVLGLLIASRAPAEQFGGLEYDMALNLERSALDGLSLGEDQTEDRLEEKDYEFEFSLEYELTDRLYLFFTGALTDESEVIETAGREDEKSGLERKQMGIGYFFGEQVVSELNAGRVEFRSASDWWVWWDEELDAIRLESTWRNFDTMLAVAEEQARAHSDDDFIDPEFDGVRRTLASLAWRIADNQSLLLYYLDQKDRSESFEIGEVEDIDRIDEEDADLSWSGIGYLAEFDFERAGNFGLELQLARVSGDETVYEFGDPDMGTSEVEDKIRRKVEGEARGLRLQWTPAQFDEITLTLGRASGDGDGNPDDNRNDSFRQTGLQGDSESFGELFQPELSNLEIDLVALAWRPGPKVEISLQYFDYRQRELADSMRDVSLEPDPNGLSRDLGRETDLVLRVTPREGLELILTAAEFEAGKAYGDFSRETSSFFKFELDYEF